MQNQTSLKFGLFKTKINFNRLNDEIMTAFGVKTTNRRKAHNKRILEKYTKSYNKLVEDLEAGIEEDLAISCFHTRNLTDYELFCLTYIKLDNNLPMFPAPWQSVAAEMCEKFEIISGLMSRKIGKSAFLSSYIPFTMINHAPEHIVLFAPTEDQLVVMADLYRCILFSDFIKEEFVIVHGGREKRGKIGMEEIIFARQDIMSDVISMNLSLNTEGDTKRGQKGTTFVVDEKQMVNSYIYNTVIEPMLSDAYTKKRLVEFGTPNRRHEPNADVIWNELCLDPDAGTLNFDWTEGVDQGCLRASYMRKVFKNNAIPCPFGRFHGMCGIKNEFTLQDGSYYRGDQLRIDERNGELKLPGYDEYDTAWKCNKCCEYYNSFVEEYCAKFGKFSDEVFPDTVMMESGDPKLRWKRFGENGRKYVLSADIGVIMYPSQIGVFEVEPERLTMIYWEEIPPLRVVAAEGGEPPSYDPVIKRIKELANNFNSNGGKIVRYYIDVTNQLQVSKQLVTGDNPIDRTKIYSNDTADNKDVLGVWNTGPFNHQMKEHYQKMLISRKIKVPTLEPFWSKYLKEHKEVIVKRTDDGRYFKYAPPRRTTTGIGTIDILDMMSMAALELKNPDNIRPSKHILIGRKGKAVHVIGKN